MQRTLDDLDAAHRTRYDGQQPSLSGEGPTGAASAPMAGPGRFGGPDVQAGEGQHGDLFDAGQRYLGPAGAAPVPRSVLPGQSRPQDAGAIDAGLADERSRPLLPSDAAPGVIAPTTRPEYERISRGTPTPADIPALVDVPNRVAFTTAEAAMTGQNPSLALQTMGTEGGRQARGAELLAAAGMPEGPARAEAGRIVDAALDWTNAIPGLTLSKKAGLVRQLVVEPLGAVVGSDVAGKLGEMVAGEQGRAVGELAGGLVGAGTAGSQYEAIAADPSTQRMGIVRGGGLSNVPAVRRVEEALGRDTKPSTPLGERVGAVRASVVRQLTDRDVDLGQFQTRAAKAAGRVLAPDEMA